MSETAVNGKVVQVIGATIDAEYPEGHLPSIYNALKIDQGDISLTLEVQQHLGGNRVRAIAMASTDGVVRNMEIIDTGSPIMVPVGEEVLGRVFNLLGEPVDKLPPAEVKEYRAIHADAVAFEDLYPGVRDRNQGGRPSHTVLQGWKDRTLRRCRIGQDGVDSGIDQQRGDQAWWILLFRRSGRKNP